MSEERGDEREAVGSADAPAAVGAETAVVRTFMTHDMKDEDILSLATGRVDELARILDAIRRSRTESPGALQHVVLYGPRGFGKSFMTRRVQIEVEQNTTANAPVPYVLLPEEQHNLTRNPHAFLDYIASRLSDLADDSDESWEGSMFQWPDAGKDAERWDEAADALEGVLDTVLPGGEGMVIVAVENFDRMLASVFKDELAEQRLRAWLDRPRNRVMLLATATGTVDLDYDRPLFHAFESVRLMPWTAEDCIAYFNRRRAREGQPELEEQLEAKARAVADFIGGNPRLAQLLASVLETQDALTVVETMNALADKLADYYRERIADLPPLAQGLLDALIRGGEQASQTELAKRVRADSQSTIARVMGELQRGDIIRGIAAPDTRETLYSVTDRVFVHYYRVRQGNRATRETPLATILDFLKTFYTRTEQKAEALRHLEAGRTAEAALFRGLAPVESKDRGRTWSFARSLKLYLASAPVSLGTSTEDILTLLNESPEEAHEFVRNLSPTEPVAVATTMAIRAEALRLMGQLEEARRVLDACVRAVAGDPIAEVIAIEEMRSHHLSVSRRAAAEIGLRYEAIRADSLPKPLALRRHSALAWSLAELARYDEALLASHEAASLAEEIGDRREESVALRFQAYSLGQLSRHDEAVEAAEHAATLANEVGNKLGEAVALQLKANSLGRLSRHDEAVDTAEHAAGLANEVDDKLVEAVALRFKAYSLGRLNRHDEAVEAAEHAATLANEVDDKFEVAVALRLKAHSLYDLGQHDEAVDAAEHAARLANEVDDKFEEAAAIGLKADSLGQLGQHGEAYDSAEASWRIALDAGDDVLTIYAAANAVVAARNAPRSGVVKLYESWLEAHQRSEEVGVESPAFWLDDLFAATARARAFVDLEEFIGNHREWLEASRPGSLRIVGTTLADIAAEEGTAAGYEAVAGILPLLASFMPTAEFERSHAPWLSSITSAFAQECRDPGLLADVARLLRSDELAPKLPPDASEQAQLLLTLAEIDAAEDPQAALARVDPDRAMLIRRLRGLPDPKPRRTKGRRKKR